MNQSKKIIVNGDDFGYSSGVNEGIMKAYESGILTSTTIMANLLKDWIDLHNVKKPKLVKPKLGIGVHLNITSGRPLSASWPQTVFSRPLKGENVPQEWIGSTWRHFLAQFTSEQLIAEYEAQIKKAIDFAGSVDHLDSHVSNASYPPADEVYFSLAKKYNLAVRPLAPFSEVSQYGGNMIIDASFYHRAKLHKIKTVDSADLRYTNKNIFYTALEKMQPGEVIEFMFHPATDDSHGDWRKADLDLLISNETVERIEQLGIVLTTYKETAHVL